MSSGLIQGKIWGGQESPEVGTLSLGNSREEEFVKLGRDGLRAVPLFWLLCGQMNNRTAREAVPPMKKRTSTKMPSGFVANGPNPDRLRFSRILPREIGLTKDSKAFAGENRPAAFMIVQVQGHGRAAMRTY